MVRNNLRSTTTRSTRPTAAGCSSMAPQETTCPSFPAQRADSVIGVIGRDGSVGFLAAPIPVTPGLLEGLADATGQELEARYRFAGTCLRTGCSQWDRGQCGAIADAVARSASALLVTAPLVHCAVRPSCRWWAELGRSACASCPSVTGSVASPVGVTDPGRCRC